MSVVQYPYSHCAWPLWLHRHWQKAFKFPVSVCREKLRDWKLDCIEQKSLIELTAGSVYGASSCKKTSFGKLVHLLSRAETLNNSAQSLLCSGLKMNFDAGTYASNSLLCHKAAQGLRKYTPDGGDCGVMLKDASYASNVLPRKKNIDKGTSCKDGCLQSRGSRQKLISDTRNSKFRESTCIAHLVQQNSIFKRNLLSTLNKQDVAMRTINES